MNLTRGFGPMPIKYFFFFITMLFSFNVVSFASAATKELTWAGCGISKKGFMNDLAKAYEEKTGVKINIAGGGATKGLRHVASGKINMGGSCRLPLVFKKEDGTSQVLGIEKNLNVIPVGWDALVVIVKKENKMLGSISTEQLRDIFTGKIKNWKELDGKTNKPINLYVRKGKISGVGLTLRQQLFNNTDQEFSKSATVLKSSGKIEKALEKDPYGIAVSGISSSRHRKLTMVKLDGVEPTMQNLKKSKYKLYRILFLVAPKDYLKNPDIKAFVDFALSIKGQKVIKKAGTLPYRQGFGLLRTAASFEYLRAMDVVDQAGLYTLGGH
jgi:phosphate transport system substrate-binding protein